MRFGISTLLFLSTACSSVEAVALQPRIDAPSRVVRLNLERNQISNPLEHDKRRVGKRATVTGNLDNEQTLYFLNASIGTPPQSLRLHLDTGSSDLWVNTPGSAFCKENNNPCSSAGTYVANSSSTYAYVNSIFNITYVDGTGAAGDYATETLTFSGQSITGLQFGIGYESSSSQGIVGIGYEANEVQATRAGRTAYRNLPAQMVSQGLINRNAYSLWLDDRESNTGTILFGGVDTSRYDGQLVTVPILRSNGVFNQFLVTMTGLGVGSNNSVATNLAQPVLLDSGTSLTYLPDQVTSDIYSLVNATYRSNQGVAFVPCSLGQQTGNITFRFDSPAAISVPLSELVLDLGNRGPQQLRFGNNPSCVFGIVPAGQGSSVLGDTFLRSAYVVYDLDNNEISLAQSNFDPTATTNVVEIQSGSSSVPSAVVAVGGQSGVPGSGVRSQNDGVAANPNMVAVVAVVVTTLAFVGGLLI